MVEGANLEYCPNQPLKILMGTRVPELSCPQRESKDSETTEDVQGLQCAFLP